MRDEEEEATRPTLHDEDDKFVLRHESATPASQTNWFRSVSHNRRSGGTKVQGALTSDP